MESYLEAVYNNYKKKYKDEYDDILTRIAKNKRFKDSTKERIFKSKSKFLEEFKELSFCNNKNDGNTFVLNILKDFLNCNLIYETFWGDRLNYDSDTFYFKKVFEALGYENRKITKTVLRADTMVSFWTPYSIALSKAYLTPNNGKRYIKSNNLHLNELITMIEKGDSRYTEVNEKFNEFASIYHTSGNILFLPPRNPDGRMNNLRYSYSEDRIDKSILECFPGKVLSIYFGDESDECQQLHNLQRWIISEKLEWLFCRDGKVNEKEILESSLLPINKNKQYDSYLQMSDNELLYNYIDEISNFIKFRSKLITSELDKMRVNYELNDKKTNCLR